MRIWIVNPYGNLPGEGWTPYRAEWLGRALGKRGHSVAWWASNFEHRTKKFRKSSSEDLTISPGFNVRIVPTTAYARHISFARIRSERTYARNLVRCAEKSNESPDLVIHVEPAVFWYPITLALIKRKKALLIIDILDLWPELFSVAFPKYIRWCGKIALWPLYHRRRKFLKEADGILAVSNDYLNVAKKIAPLTLSLAAYIGAERSLLFREQRMGKSDVEKGRFVIIYSGTFGEGYDIRTVLEAANTLMCSDPAIMFVFVGAGPLAAEIQLTAAKQVELHGQKNIKLIGSVPQSELGAIYANADCALTSYVKESTVSMPLKAYDYFAAGLPIINSLRGELATIIIENDVGLQYRPGHVLSLVNAIREIAARQDWRDPARERARALAMKFESTRQHERAADFIEMIYERGQSIKS